MVDTRGGRRYALIFFVAAFLILLLGRWLQPVDHVALSIAAPFQSVISSMAGGLGDGLSGVVQGPGLRSENGRLRTEIATLLQRNVVLRAQSHDDQLLRRMLNFDVANNRMNFLTARVIGNPPDSLEPALIINRGARDGLRVDMTVVDQGGYFVGKVSDVASNAAKVQLMISPSSSVGAMDLTTRATGLVEGKYASRPRLLLVPTSAKLRIGDFVVTSGQMNLFPRMLLIGQVQRVYRSNVNMFQEAELRPMADFQNLEIVQVIRNRQPGVPAKLVKGP